MNIFFEGRRWHGHSQTAVSRERSFEKLRRHFCGRNSSSSFLCAGVLVREHFINILYIFFEMFFYKSPFCPICPSKIKNRRAVVFQVFFYVFNCFFFNFSRWRPNRPIHPRKIIKFIFVIGIDRLHSCAQACWFVNISLLDLWVHSSQMAIPSNTSLEKVVVTFFLFLIVFRHFFIYFFFSVGHKWPSVQ